MDHFKAYPVKTPYVAHKRPLDHTFATSQNKIPRYAPSCMPVSASGYSMGQSPAIQQAFDMVVYLKYSIAQLHQYINSLDGDPMQIATDHLFAAEQSLLWFIEIIRNANTTPAYPQPNRMIRAGPLHTAPPSNSIPWNTTSLKDMMLLHTIGTGTFGEVRLCKHVSSEQLFCVKILELERIRRLKQEDHIENERNILFLCANEAIVKLYTVLQTPTSFYFVMEYIPGGELFSLIRQRGRLSNAVTKIYAKEILLMIEYLHTKSITHRDLKPENLVLTSTGHLKLTDFGFAKQTQDILFTMCGTPEYIAPEIILAKGYGKGVDWWCLGILIYEMLVGSPPFQGQNNGVIFKNILDCRLKIPNFVNKDAADLIRRLLVVDITQRVGCMAQGSVDIRKHVWFRGVDWHVDFNSPGPILPKLQPTEANLLPSPSNQPYFPNF